MSKRVFTLFKKTVQPDFTTIVSGLPRSGTSMMMQILEAGGIKPVTDLIRQADQDNQKGYYEHELVKQLEHGNLECLQQSQGHAIKIVSPLLHYLPNNRHYKVLFMNRDLSEVLASQAKMLTNLGSLANQSNDLKLQRLYVTALAKTRQWLMQQKHIDVLYLEYADTVNRPYQQLQLINHFLGVTLNKRPALSVIDKGLRHHNS